MEERLARLEKTVKSLEDGLATNTALTKKIHENLSDLVDLMEVGRSGMKVLEFLGRLAKPLVAIATFCGVVFAHIKAGEIWSTFVNFFK
jgi:hypothetical protein